MSAKKPDKAQNDKDQIDSVGVDKVEPPSGGDSVSIIIDADDYFTHARNAMLQAEKRIVMIGWDFDARVVFGTAARGDNGPQTIGDFIYWIVQQNPELNVHLLRWGTGAFTTLFRGKTIFTLAKWMTHPRIHIQLDNAHPMGSSHHQKLILIDDIMAFCGGIDVMGYRWDTRAHHDEEPRRRFPRGQSYPPWHDAASAVKGPIVGKIADACYERWDYAGGEPLDRITGAAKIWPKGLKPDFTEVDVTLALTLPELPDKRAALHGVETLYLDHIQSAKQHIYIESQYFCSRTISEAMAERLAEDDGPEIIVINPLSADGWLEPIFMDTARARVYKALKLVDKHNRLRIYHPVTSAGNPIYCHSKIMIIDDLVLNIGSSNLNNRSMRLDTEADIAVMPHGDAHRRKIIHIRNDLLAEHLGCDIQEIAEQLNANASLIECIETLRGIGKTLVPYEMPELKDAEKWVADNEVMDPHGPEEMFEKFSKRGLFSGDLSLRRNKRPTKKGR